MSSPTSAQTVLDAMLERERQERASSLNHSKFFNLYTVEQILKNYGLSYEEIESGIVDGGDDGGIDAIYTFVNGVLIGEDSNFEHLKENIQITTFILQAKTSAGFSEHAILNFESTAKDLLDTSHEIADYETDYNEKLIRAIGIFRNAYKVLSSKLPDLLFSFQYATKGEQIHPKVEKKAEHLKSVIKGLFTDCQVKVDFVGADKLLSLSRKAKAQTLPLQTSEALATISMGTICLVRLKDYYNFITDSESGELRNWLFEENVRDYEGKNVEVNKGIRRTLEAPNPNEDFWWLNNGITIVAGKAPMDGKTLTLTEPKVVNGLQTSIEIYNQFRTNPETQGTNKILVRAIVTNNDRTRNDIIKATNSQSAIKAASLRAFNEIHYRIEEYLGVNGLFYDRRKNYYKNQKKPKDKIVSISYVAQAVAAIILQRPNDSRGRPINLIKNEALYNKTFNEAYPIELYLYCTKFMKEVDKFLNSDDAPKFIRGHEINVRYQLAMFAATMQTGRTRVTSKYLVHHPLGDPSLNVLKKSLTHVWAVLNDLKAKKDDDENKVAKSLDFDIALKTRIVKIIKAKALAF